THSHIRVDRIRASRQQVTMNGESFRRLHAAFAIDLGHVVEKGQFLVEYPRARFSQPGNRVRETARYSLIQVFERRTLHDPNAQPRKRYRLVRSKFFRRHDCISFGAGLDPTPNRTNRIDAVRQRESAVSRDALPAGLVADNSAKRAGDAA